MKLSRTDQNQINTCYVYVRAALDILDTIAHRDTTLEQTQQHMYKIENILHQYVGPVDKEAV